MSRAEDLLNEMTSGDVGLYIARPETEPHIVVGEDRFITVPEELQRIAVQFDHAIETVTFDCPRYWDGHDMSKMKVYINFMRVDGERGAYIADNVRVDDSDSNIMHFEWTITRDVTLVKGKISFLVCVKKTDDDANEVNHWNSELNQEMYVSEGLECVESVISQYPDLITQLLFRMDSAEEIVNTAGPLAIEASEKAIAAADSVAYIKSKVDAVDDAKASVEADLEEIRIIADELRNIEINDCFIVGGDQPAYKCLWFNTGGAGATQKTSSFALNRNSKDATVFAEIDDVTYGVDNATIGKTATENNYNFDII